MLFKALASIHEGSIATGDLSFISIPQVDLTSDAVSPMDSSSDLQGQGESRRDEDEPTTSESSGKKGVGPVRKRKQSQVALALEDYIDSRKKQSATLVEELKESKQDDLLSIGNCVAVLEPMEELYVAEKQRRCGFSNAQ